MKVSKARAEPQTIGIAAVQYHITITPRAGQHVPDKVTFFFVLRHATRPNIRLVNSSSRSVAASI